MADQAQEKENVRFEDFAEADLLRRTLKVFPSLYLRQRAGFLEGIKRRREVYSEMDTPTSPLAADRGSGAENLDCNPQTSVDRCVSAFASLHYSPREEYFEQRDATDHRRKSEDKPDPDFLKAVRARTLAIHEWLQTGGNAAVEAQFIRSKVVHGVAGKHFMFDGSKFTCAYFPPEDLCIASSDGLEFDIYGGREKVTQFMAARRFPSYVESLQKSVSTPDKGGEVVIYTTQMPLSVFESVALINCERGAGGDSAKKVEALKSYMAVKPKMPWIECVYTENGEPLQFKSLPCRSMVVGICQPAHTRLGVPDGYGKRAVPTAVLLSMMVELNINARERNLAPPWGVPDAAKGQGFTMSRDAIFFYGAGGGPPTPMAFPASVGDMIAFSEYYLKSHDRAFHADSFELVSAYNMTKREVSAREASDLQKLTLYVIQDEKDNLSPSVRYANACLDEVEPSPLLQGRPLLARYISPLALAHKNDYFSKLEKLFVMLANSGNAIKTYPLTGVVMDDYKLIMTLIEKLNLTEVIRNGREIELRLESQRMAESAKARADSEKAINSRLSNDILRKELGAAPPGPAAAPPGPGAPPPAV